MLNKLHFNQPKYVLPILGFVPFMFVLYFLCDIFGEEEKKEVAVDYINTELPQGVDNGLKSKLSHMLDKYAKEDDDLSPFGTFEPDRELKDSIENPYANMEPVMLSENSELAEKQRQLQELDEMIAQKRNQLNSDEDYSYDSQEDYLRQVEEMQVRAYQRQLEIRDQMNPEKKLQEERLKAEQERLAKLEEEKLKNKPELVVKSEDTNKNKFNTINRDIDTPDAPLIRAMIDQTTKAHEGTRLRFKLLDNVSVKGIKLPKGTYLYGTVKGFGQQRVMAEITSVLIGSEFVKINLSVYDNDGMEGFYVPESSFRDFVKNAGGEVANSNVNFTNGSTSTTGINAEYLALQAMQNVYNSASSAISANIRKNKAKIKYNTIVYLINKNEYN